MADIPCVPTGAPIALAVIGHPVGHSLSPAMHTAALKAAGIPGTYVAVDVLPGDVGDFVRRARVEFKGFNVTVPHKAAVIPFLHRVDIECVLSDSVNTVSISPSGEASGTSTDGYGLEKALEEEFAFRLAGASILFVGCGGAAQAVAGHLAASGARALAFANRTAARAADFAARLKSRFPSLSVAFCGLGDETAVRRLAAEADLIVQSTSLGLKPGDPLPLPLSALRPGLPVYDMVYGETPLLRAARGMGCPAADGRLMLLHQGARSFEIWTGRPAPVEAMRAAVLRALEARRAKDSASAPSAPARPPAAGRR